MKVYFLLPLLFLFSSALTAQEEFKRKADTTASGDNQVFTIVEESALFPGGNDAMAHFIKRNMHYPKKCKRKKQVGLVIIAFTIEKNGSISNVYASKEVEGAPELTAEAIRVIRAMPRWTPGKINGRPVRVMCSVPIRFSLK